MKRRNPFRSEPPHKGNKRESPAYLQHTGRNDMGLPPLPPKKHAQTSNYRIQCYIKFPVLPKECFGDKKRLFLQPTNVKRI